MGGSTSKKTQGKPVVAHSHMSVLRRHYDIHSIPLGEGRFGRVFKAINPEGKPVALKIVSKKKLTFKEKECIDNEVNILESVNHHPGVLQFIDCTECDEYLALATEFVPGKTLMQISKESQAKEFLFFNESIVTSILK